MVVLELVNVDSRQSVHCTTKHSNKLYGRRVTNTAPPGNHPRNELSGKSNLRLLIFFDVYYWLKSKASRKSTANPQHLNVSRCWGFVVDSTANLRRIEACGLHSDSAWLNLNCNQSGCRLLVTWQMTSLNSCIYIWKMVDTVNDVNVNNFYNFIKELDWTPLVAVFNICYAIYVICRLMHEPIRFRVGWSSQWSTGLNKFQLKLRICMAACKVRLNINIILFAVLRILAIHTIKHSTI